MTSGRRPALLAGVLAALRDVADEVVVAADERRADDVHAAVAGIADEVLAFPPRAPADRPIAWLFGACSGAWIFNVDDDEVPSPSLVAALPALVRREDITHAWVARRWLHPTVDTYLGASPWGTEFQLRLALADERFLQFSDVFHRPLVCSGPSAYVDAPLWHLDTVLNPAAWRRQKARAYEAERPGMRLDGLAHNLGLYVPELHPQPDLRPVPPGDREAIASALASPPLPVRAFHAPLRHVSAEEVDARWPGAPFADTLYRATLSADTAPRAMRSGIQHTVDVLVTNESDVTWRWGREARPEIRLGCRWRRDGHEVEEPVAPRTVLPSDLPPGATALVPVHVVAPEAPGRYELELDLVHEGLRWFGCGTTIPVDVARRTSVAIVAPPEGVTALAAELEPGTEPVVLLRDEADRAAYGDYRSLAGPRPWLLRGTERRGRVRTLAGLLRRTAVAATAPRSQPQLEPLLELRDASDALIVVEPNWSPDAAFGREWWALATTALLWRRGGKTVAIGDAALPGAAGARGALVRWALRRIRTSSG